MSVRIVYQQDNEKLLEYSPTIFKPLLIDFEKMRFVRRVRFLKEYIEGGYKVYYLEKKGQLIGYCVVAGGGRRLKCSTKEDIVLGPYYIDQKFRGHGYSEELIRLVLENTTYSYKTAYDFIEKTNVPSMRATIQCGFRVYGELNVVGLCRKLKEVSSNGTHTIYCKELSEKKD